jgi:ribosome-associated translation inhibitor RaiA
MQVPLHIKFHGVDPSPYLEQRIREHVAKLETLCDRITRCEVVIELPHLHHRNGKQFHVRIDFSVPGHEIVVSRDPGVDEAHEDPYVAVRDAFLAARRQLEDHLHKVRDDKIRAQEA